MEIRMDGRRALITGGSQGLGFAMAKRFAESGADVALLARRPDYLAQAKHQIESTTGQTAWTYPCDVGRADQIDKMYAVMIRDFGPVDVLVNNAGSSQHGKFEELTDQAWQDDFDLKLFGAIRLGRLVAPGMRERQWGRIINILNIGAKAPSPEGAPTQVTRAAGLALTKVLAGEYAPHNVLVNALLTGTIITDQVRRRHERLGKNNTLEEQIVEEGKSVPLGRMGTADEYANLACFLASDAASYITGTAINVDGGMSPVI
ncbi:SDR family oxidoreductase [Alphaproteobacteria bacterium]|nr:SDR family oxidoreductase [Alphaproteobacteria bacterium]